LTMLLRFSGFLLLILLVEISVSSHVIPLTSSNFTQVYDEGVWLIEFYAPWCGHCKAFAPKFEEIAKKLQGKVHVGAVDVDKEKSLGNDFSIRLLPTIKMFTKMEVVDYQGPREVEDMVQYGTNMATKWSSNLKSEDEPIESDVITMTAQEFDTKVQRGKSGKWLLEFYADWCTHSKGMAPIFSQLATLNKESITSIKMDMTELNTRIAKRFNVTPFGRWSLPRIFLIENGRYRVFTGDSSLKDLQNFLIGRRDNETIDFPIDELSMEDSLEEALGLIKEFIDGHIWISLGSVFIYGVILGKLVLGRSSNSRKIAPRSISSVSPKKSVGKPTENSPKNKPKKRTTKKISD